MTSGVVCVDASFIVRLVSRGAIAVPFIDLWDRWQDLGYTPVAAPAYCKFALKPINWIAFDTHIDPMRSPVPVTSSKSANRLFDQTPQAGFEPATNRLTVDRSTTELLRITITNSKPKGWNLQVLLQNIFGKTFK